MDNVILNQGEKALDAWTEVEDKTLYLCMDLDDGQTIEIELDAPAIDGIRKAIEHGPIKQR